MNFASEDLRHEHEGILSGLEILAKIVDQLAANQDVEPGDMGEMINFFRLFADKCHHGKEEDFYFPALLATIAPEQDGANARLMEQLLAEHDEGREYLARMSEALEKSLQAEDFTRAATGYVQLMRRHIQRENEDLFPWGDARISADKHVQLLQTFEKFEEEVIGAGIHEKLHQLLHHLAHKYLDQNHVSHGRK